MIADNTKGNLFLKIDNIYILLEQNNVNNLCYTTKILNNSIAVCLSMCLYRV